MYDDGLTSTKISESLGICKTTVLRILERNGYDRRAPGTRIPPKQYDEAIELYLKGENINDIAKKVGISAKSINAELNRRNIQARPRGVSVPEYKVDKIIELYKCGMSIKQICKELNVGSNTVSKSLKKGNITVKRAGCPNQITECTKDKIVSLYLSGKTSSEIAEAINISNSTITKIIKDRGIQLRKNIVHNNKAYVNRINKLYSCGESLTKIANDLGISKVTVSNIVKKNNMQRLEGKMV